MIYPRSTIGTPQPPSTRYRLSRVKVLLAHEVGVNTPATGRYRSADPARVLSDAKAAAAYGISANKSWEYNWMIGLNGWIFTQAGEYMGSHCKNFNTDSAGVIFLNATDVPLTPEQIDSWFEVQDYASALGVLASGYETAPHYRYRSTSCCGIHANPPGWSWASPTGEGRVGNLIPALRSRLLTPPPLPPTPPPVPNYQRIAMAQSFEFASATRWDTRGFGNFLAVGEYTCKLDGSEGKVGVTVNVTVIPANVGGFASCWSDGTRPNSSKLNWGPGQVVANEINVPLAADGSFKIYISAPAHIIIDLAGYWLA